MLELLLRKRNIIQIAPQVRDLMIEMLEEVKKGVQDKKTIDETIEVIKSMQYNSPEDIIKAYKAILALSEMSIHNKDLQYNGYPIPTNPFTKAQKDKYTQLLNS
jgi:hypothetical protein